MAISQQLVESLLPSVTLSEDLAQGRRDRQQQGLGRQKLRLGQIEQAQGELRAKAQEANALLAFDNPEMMRAAMVRRAQELHKNPEPGLEPTDLIDMANRLGEANGFNTIKKELEGDLLRIQNISGQLTAKQREFGGFTEGLSEEDKLSARRIELGLDPRAIGSAAQTITTEGTAEQVAGTEEVLAGGKETGKLKARLKFKPQIAKAVSLARSEAAARGETLTNVKRMKAALPGLNIAVSQLRELAPIATSTFGGRAFDFAVKETGFGSTTGANARAKFIGIVANQVLPLLRQTFGAAFTAQEGESLKAAMADPDASPTQKMVQLDAFIAQKVRDIEAGEIELGTDTGLPAGLPEGTTDNGDGTFTLPNGDVVEPE